MKVYGDDDAPHGHMHLRFENVRVPKENLILGEGRGFEIAQGRLGPGRIHHCMRAIGQAEMALEMMCQRSLSREAFGEQLAQLGANFDIIAECRMEIEMARLLCLKAAWMIDQGDARAAAPWISQIKVVAPRVALKVTDEAVQMHGAKASARTRRSRAVDASEDAAAGRRAGRGAPPPGGAGRAQALHQPEDLRCLRCEPQRPPPHHAGGMSSHDAGRGRGWGYQPEIPADVVQPGRAFPRPSPLRVHPTPNPSPSSCRRRVFDTTGGGFARRMPDGYAGRKRMTSFAHQAAQIDTVALAKYLEARLPGFKGADHRREDGDRAI